MDENNKSAVIKSNAEKNAYWRQLSQEWEQSAEPQEKFCANRNINYAQFLYWRMKFTKENKISQHFMPLKIKDTGLARHTRQTDIQLHLSRGVMLSIPPQSDKNSLSTILNLLGVI